METNKFLRMCKTPPKRKLPSRTIPGQSLIPSELLKRHLAGTLPDIAMRAQYTHDEDGNQIDEDLTKLELHELRDLAERVREAVRERHAELAEKNKTSYDQEVIERYLEAEKAKQATATPKANTAGEGSTDQNPAPTGP